MNCYTTGVCVDCGDEWSVDDTIVVCPECGSLNVGVLTRCDEGELDLGVVRKEESAP